MFIISLTYKVPIEAVEAHLQAHIAWLETGYDDGVFIASGRKVPRIGGVILARGEQAAVEAYCRRDPFIVNDLADFEITEVAFSMSAEGFEALKS